MRSSWRGSVVLAVLAAVVPAGGAEIADQTLEGVLKEAGVSSDSVGLCVDIGCGDGKLALEMARKTKMTVFALARDEASQVKARGALAGAGFYGARATAAIGSLKALPFPDRYANLILTSEYGEDLNLKEVARVLSLSLIHI